MGLTTRADAPEGKIKNSGVMVAKNYLSQDEMKQLNRMVTAYLDFAESMTLRHIPLTMQDWEKGSIASLKCLITVFCRMQVRWQLKLQSFMRRQNLKNIAWYRTDYSCPTLIGTCWSWKKVQRNKDQIPGRDGGLDVKENWLNRELNRSDQFENEFSKSTYHFW